jgi:hypothetical protein
MPFPEPIKGALEGAGLSAESLDRIRLARGFVGKASYVAGVALLVLGAIAIRGGGEPPLMVGATVLIFSIYFGGALWFAHRHPGEALLEGAELIKWRQLEMAAKNMPQLPQQAPREIGSDQDHG